MRSWRSRFVVLILGVFGSLALRAQDASDLAFQRSEHLRRGVNLSIWYAQTRDYSAARLESFTTPADFTLIKSLGMDHVRLSINPEPLIGDPATGSLRPDAFEHLDRTVKQILASGLNLVLDIHPEDPWKTAMTKDDAGTQKFLTFWSAFATHYADTDPNRVFFEVMNEPISSDLARWQTVQTRLIEQIRKAAPEHTIIATPASWGSLDSLLALQPVHDSNVIYTFHYYTPFWFTHQGATWGSKDWIPLRGVPYPSTPENIQPILGQEPDDVSRLHLARYGWDRWNAPRIGSEIAAAAEWGKQHHVPLYMGEFGVFKEYSNPAMRVMWISDVRTAAESKHIGWCMWDYQTNFGMVSKGPNGTAVDDGVVRALGLKQ